MNVVWYVVVLYVNVEFVCGGEVIVLMICDDGVGFDFVVLCKLSLFGLVGLCECVYLVGGMLWIVMMFGEGMMVEVEILWVLMFVVVVYGGDGDL